MYYVSLKHCLSVLSGPGCVLSFPVFITSRSRQWSFTGRDHYTARAEYCRYARAPATFRSLFSPGSVSTRTRTQCMDKKDPARVDSLRYQSQYFLFMAQTTPLRIVNRTITANQCPGDDSPLSRPPRTVLVGAHQRFRPRNL